MAKAINHVGERFGKLSVLSRADNESNRAQSPQWHCVCDCGKRLVVPGYRLRRGQQSCGCAQVEDLIGKTFGEWTVLSREGSKQGHAMWSCRCSCGTLRVQYATNLRKMSGNESCGCLRPSKSGAWGSGYLTPSGYRMVYRPGHPNAPVSGKMFEHVAVMADVLGRPLNPGENVHHKNGVRADNRPENLELWTTTQPSGQRVIDLLDWAYKIIEVYGPEQLTLRLVG